MVLFLSDRIEPTVKAFYVENIEMLFQTPIT